MKTVSLELWLMWVDMLVKVIFTNIHKISDARANSFGIYIMIAQYMKNDFTFY